MWSAIGILIILSVLPITELRASIPFGILQYTDLAPWLVILTCILANIAIAPVVFILLDGMIRLFCKMKWFERLYERYQERIVRKMAPKIEKYGVWGLAVFIGIPIPGSGVYSGAVGAHALGFKLRKYMTAAVFGVIMAGALVTAITYGVKAGVGWLEFFIKKPV
ncbi:COG2426 family protein [Planctomycetota bacterium]